MNKIPPHSIEAEQSIIGSMLIDEKCINKVIESIKSEHFYNLSHVLIYKTCQELTASKKSIDLVSVTDLLERKSHLDDAGGFSYIAELARNTPSSANVSTYCSIVIDKWNGRKIIEAAHQAIESIYGGECYQKTREGLYDGLEGLFLDNGEELIAGGKELSESLTDELERLMSFKDGMTGLSTGDQHIDEAAGGFHGGDYIGMAARSGGGKTTKAMNILAHYTKMNRRSLFFSMEMKKQKAMMKLVSDMANVPFTAIKNPSNLDELQWHRLSDTMEFVKNSKLHIDDSSGLGIEDIERKARQLKAKYGELDLIIVDYIQRMRVGDNQYQGYTEASNRLKDLFMELDCTGIVLAQFKKNSVGFPNASDLRETGAIENDSDVLIFLHTPSEDLKPHKGMLTAEIFNKVRFGETGVKMLTNELDYQRFKCSDQEFVEEETTGRFK